MIKKGKAKVMVIGHRNPDTDSVCSAIAYAHLKSRIDPETRYEPCRAGELNQETAYVLSRFHMKTPRRVVDVSAQVQDIEIRDVEPVSGQTTMRRAWEIMRDKNVSMLPITDAQRHLEGVITLNDLGMANMDVEGTGVLAEANTSFEQIRETLNGTFVTGSGETRMNRGKIVIGAASPEALEEIVQPGDVVILANRYETHFCAIEMGAACIVVCMGAQVSKTIARLAEDRGCAIITTPCDTYEVARLINQSAPIAHYMIRDGILTFKLATSVEEARKVMGEVRLHYFPVLDKQDCYVGMISHRNLLNLRRKQVIFVDHNETTQAVEGHEQADILEIIDHHRLGDMQTNAPMYFRNQPVGCTATIIDQMFGEQCVEIPADIAGLLLSAILSDTLMFRSPTCTPMDIAAAKKLAKIANVEIETLAREMFEAGENVEGRTAAEVFMQDFKTFSCGELHFGVGQGSYVNEKNREAAKALLGPYLEEARRTEKLDMIFYMFTSVLDQESDVLCAGKDAEALLEGAFDTKASGGAFVLPGVISRKKQMIPAMIGYLQTM